MIRFGRRRLRCSTACGASVSSKRFVFIDYGPDAGRK
jgi:hypothetical protein